MVQIRSHDHLLLPRTAQLSLQFLRRLKTRIDFLPALVRPIRRGDRARVKRQLPLLLLSGLLLPPPGLVPDLVSERLHLVHDERLHPVRRLLVLEPKVHVVLADWLVICSQDDRRSASGEGGTEVRLDVLGSCHTERYG
jgi:hypothetical protein